MTGYFETMGIPIVAGRGFEPADAASSGMVAVINESLADKFWNGQNPIGQRLRPPWGDWVPMFTVIGVAKDVKQGGVDRKTGTEFYFFVDQMARRPSPLGRAPLTINVVLRTTLPASALSQHDRANGPRGRPNRGCRTAARDGRCVCRVDQPAAVVGPADRGVCGTGAALAAIGTYGVLSYVVAQRRREIGIRLALGADRARLVGHIVKHGLTLTAAGVVIGLVAAFGLSRVLTSLLFGVAPTDLSTSILVIATMTLVGTLASSIPAWRASRVDPSIVLRAE